jgi:peptidoglycan/LPS O-acetylase OafA/YrhL
VKFDAQQATPRTTKPPYPSTIIMKLSTVTGGVDNNFNLIRMLAALFVLISHSFFLTGHEDPILSTLGFTMGNISVDVFFLTSGFLVTSSLISKKSLIEFMVARTLRIFPALLTMLALTVFGLGLYFTTTPKSTFITHPKVYFYLLKCSTLFFGVMSQLPGVFETTPYKHSFNGSLWSMPIEVRLYAAIAVIWYLSRLLPKLEFRVFKHSILVLAIFSGLLVLSESSTQIHTPNAHRPIFMFLTGASFSMLQKKITLSHPLFAAMLTALIISTGSMQAFFYTYTLTIPYLLFYAAYIPSGTIRKYNELGDYSYGTYIYAFPLQQSVAALYPGCSTLLMSTIAGAVTLGAAILSWHLIEKPILRTKGACVNRARGWLNHNEKLLP